VSLSVEHSVGLAHSKVVTGVEEDIVESDKKCLLDGRNKDVGGISTDEQRKNHNPMQVDDNLKTILSTIADGVHATTTQNNHFASAIPGRHDFWEQ